jgi:hypothetical protein
LVRDTRENFRTELSENRSKLLLEIKNVGETRQAVESAIGELDEAKPDSDSLPIASKIKPSFYLFRATSWQAALSTGALAHMRAEEVGRYADAAVSTQVYSNFEDKTIEIYFELQALARSGKLTPERKEAFRTKLLLLSQHEQTLAHLADELLSSYDAALK